MNITNTLRGAMRRIAGVSFLNKVASSESLVAGSVPSGKIEGKRRTVPLPSILNTYGPRADAMPKPTPMNLRRFSETPVARRAINTIKDRIAGMRWRVQSKPGAQAQPDADARAQILTRNFETPNPDDSFRSLSEQVLEDLIVGGFGAMEVETTGDPNHPLALFPVDGATIRMRADWDGMGSSVRYEQVTGKSGPDANILLTDDELIYMRLNPRTFTPFGLGRLEVAFETINSFLGANRYAGRLASNSVVEYALWLKDATPEQHERLIRWWQNEIEGTGRIPILSVEKQARSPALWRRDGCRSAAAMAGISAAHYCGCFRSASAIVGT
jgi:hypothetical protein